MGRTALASHRAGSQRRQAEDARAARKYRQRDWQTRTRDTKDCSCTAASQRDSQTDGRVAPDAVTPAARKAMRELYVSILVYVMFRRVCECLVRVRLSDWKHDESSVRFSALANPLP